MADDANQPPPFEDLNLFATDRAFARSGRKKTAARRTQDGSRRSASAWVRPRLPLLLPAAHCHSPELKTFDGHGQRIDDVEYHPAYHAMMREGIEAGISAVAWSGVEGGHIVHAALEFLLAEVEHSVCCPSR